jgi:MFS family permease
LVNRNGFTKWQHCSLAALWFAYNVEWSAMIPIVWPAQIAAIAGPTHKEFLNGVAIAAGALVALLAAPCAGALSDRSRNPQGRRRRFLIYGVALNIASLAALGMIGSQGGIAAFLAAVLATQFAGNWWGGPYAGLIPDVAPPHEHGRASGYLMLMTGAGAIVGAAVAGPLLYRGGYWAVNLFLIFTLLLCAALTLTGVTEPSPQLARTTFPAPFFPNPARHRDFYVVLITRACITMGAFSILSFFQYFFFDVMRDPNAVLHGSILFGSVGLITLPVALLAGRQADRQGPKQIVWVSGWVMAGTAAIYVFDCFHPSWMFTIAMALIFGAGSVAYQAVDWALALSVLPEADDSGKDMGIWHVSFVLPQTIAPLIAGALLDRVKLLSLPTGYAIIFLMTALWYTLGTIPIRTIGSNLLTGRAVENAE